MSETTENKEDKEYFHYTYKVSMIVTVFSDSQESARKALDDNGGFVSSRQVELKDSVKIYSEDD
jgi:hypothetical protein